MSWAAGRDTRRDKLVKKVQRLDDVSHTHARTHVPARTHTHTHTHTHIHTHTHPGSPSPVAAYLSGGNSALNKPKVGTNSNNQSQVSVVLTGVPGKPGTADTPAVKGVKGIPGKPGCAGTLIIRVWLCREGGWRTIEMPYLKNKYSITFDDFAANLKNGSVEVC